MSHPHVTIQLFNSDGAGRMAIDAAIKAWSDNTCIRFKYLVGDSYKPDPYLRIINELG